MAEKWTTSARVGALVRKNSRRFLIPDSGIMLEKIAVMLVTSSADRPQVYSERVRKLSGLNHTKLEQDGGNSVRLIQDLLQA